MKDQRFTSYDEAEQAAHKLQRTSAQPLRVFIVQYAHDDYAVSLEPEWTGADCGWLLVTTMIDPDVCRAIEAMERREHSGKG